jgi:hypothetical protein
MVLHCTRSTAEGNLAAGETDVLLSIMRKRYTCILNFSSKKTGPKILYLGNDALRLCCVFVQFLSTFFKKLHEINLLVCLLVMIHPFAQLKILILERTHQWNQYKSHINVTYAKSHFAAVHSLISIIDHILERSHLLVRCVTRGFLKNRT